MKQPSHCFQIKRLLNEKSYLQFILRSFLVPANSEEWVQEGRSLGWAFSVKWLSVLLCVSTKKLFELLIHCSVLGKVSTPHAEYMEGRRFYLCVCGLGCSYCQNKMTHFRSDVLLTEERAASQLICMFVWVPEWITAYSIILFFQPWPTNLFLKKKKGGRAVKSIFTPSNLNRVLPIWTLLCPVEIHGNIPQRLGWVGMEWKELIVESSAGRD